MVHYPHSDVGNAQLLADLFGNCLKYRDDTQEWLHWQQAASHWDLLSRDEELRFAAETAKKRFEFLPVLELDAQKREASWALSSQNLPRMQAMLAYSKSQPPIKSTNISWDAHPLLLSCPNGVVNLTEAKLRPGARSDYITQSIDIPYDPEATCPRWMQFLDEVFDSNTDIINYVQRAVGYSITGSTKEQIFFLLHGTGANGKSKFRNIISALLGSYSQTTRFSAFEENPMGDSQRDLAELAGCRTVFASEGSERRKLDTAVLKYITGEEPIRTSRKYGHPFTFLPQFKIWLSSNYLPKVDDNSLGFWRRIVIVPFDVKFEGPRRDSNLEYKLLSELPGILNWAVAGAKEWFKFGLQTPDTLLLQVSKYKNNRDTTSRFIQEECLLDDVASVQASDLYEAYLLWCRNEQEEPMTSTMFGRKISETYSKKRSSLGLFYQGLDLRVPLE